MGWTEALESAGQLPPGTRQQREPHKHEVRRVLSTDSSREDNSVSSSSKLLLLSSGKFTMQAGCLDRRDEGCTLVLLVLVTALE